MSRIVKPLSLFISTVALISIFSIGCKPAEDPMMDLLDATLANLKIDDLSRTMDFVFSESRFEQSQFEEKMQTGLNRWANVDAADFTNDWQLPAIANDACEKYESLQSVERIGEMSFLSTDAYYIQQALWLNNIGKRLSDSRHLNPFEIYRVAADNYEPSAETKDGLAEILGNLHADLDEDGAAKLADGMRFFDWIVRNIQLEPESNPDEDEIASQRLNGEEDLAAAGVKGTGHVRYPWQSLMYSRGDYVDRAKLVLLYADLAGIDAVMFTIDDKPWCIGMAVGGKYYLFDTKLGMPIPGEKIGTIATLSDVRNNPKLLESLDLNVDESLKDETKYWVQPGDLSNLKAKLFVTPEGISKRIGQLEKKLTGKSRLKLASRPAEVIARLPKIEGVEFEAWDIAFKTHQFRGALREAIAKSSYDDVLRGKVMWHYRDEAYVDGFSTYRTARSKYFNGIFETVRNDGVANSIELFYIMIYKDDTIAKLGTDTDLQFKMGILREANQSPAEFESEIRGRQQQMKLVRRDSGYFLAHCHFDNGNFGTAINWAERLRAKSDAERWKDGVEYLRGRSYEARRQYKEAAEALKNDDSLQYHGNLIRARMLNEMSK